MEFRDLKRQYLINKEAIDCGIQQVVNLTHFIQGQQVRDLEEVLAAFVGRKHCISCANGTDALQLALMALNVKGGDAVFVPDFTFFSSGEVVSTVGATPVFVDVDQDTYNIDCVKLERMITRVINEGKITPKVIIAVDLFGQPADYETIQLIAKKYNLFIIEDGAQGFGGQAVGDKVCSFGDIATTSFFPAKPLGCYGDGGAVFTDNDEWAELVLSYRVHGKGANKYDNVRIGMNSRLDTLQAAILLAKFDVFINRELDASNTIARLYTKLLEGVAKTPIIKNGYVSSWAQYTIQLENNKQRDGLQNFLKEQGIPTAVYYQKPMHRQLAFQTVIYHDDDYEVSNRLSETVLSLPFHPYLGDDEVKMITTQIKEFAIGE